MCDIERRRLIWVVLIFLWMNLSQDKCKYDSFLCLLTEEVFTAPVRKLGNLAMCHCFMSCLTGFSLLLWWVFLNTYIFINPQVRINMLIFTCHIFQCYFWYDVSLSHLRWLTLAVLELNREKLVRIVLVKRKCVIELSTVRDQTVLFCTSSAKLLNKLNE